MADYRNISAIAIAALLAISTFTTTTQAATTNWQCYPGIAEPIRWNGANIECASTDGRSCLRTCSSSTPAGTPWTPNVTLKPLACGDAHLAKWGLTGYTDADHWCALGCKGTPGCNPPVFSGVIVNRQNNLCLDPLGYTGASGTNMMLYRCDGYADQNFTIMFDGQLINKSKKMCLDAAGTSGEGGANVALGACDKLPDQKWTLRKRNNEYELVNSVKGMCLDVSGTSAVSRDNVQLGACDGKADQGWQLMANGGLLKGQTIGLYVKSTSRFLRLKDTSSALTGEVVPQQSLYPQMTNGNYDFNAQGQLIYPMQTLTETVPPGWFYAFFLVEPTGDGKYAFRNKAYNRYLSAGSGGLIGSGEKSGLDADDLNERFTIFNTGSNTFALYSETRKMFAGVNEKGGWLWTQLLSYPPNTTTSPAAVFTIVEAPPVPVYQPASNAAPACVAALTCLLDGSMQKFLEPVCSNTCNQSGNTVSVLLQALLDKDMQSLCSSGVKAALDITELAISGFVKTAGEIVMRNAICSNDTGGSAVCPPNDNACNLKMAEVGKDPCNPKEKAIEWANEICSLDSYERDAGVGATCGSDQEMLGALCYDKCPSGYRNAASDVFYCRADCPSGYTDMGLTCTRPLTVTKKVLESCPRGYTTYPLTCTNWDIFPARTIDREGVCPRGYVDILGTCSAGGDTVAKKTTNRTPESVNTCASDRELDGLLCYNKCIPGYHGVANRCWNK